jgi:hypothetical protein
VLIASGPPSSPIYRARLRGQVWWPYWPASSRVEEEADQLRAAQSVKLGGSLVLQLWAAADNPESRRVEEEAGFTRQAAVNDCGEEFGRRVDAVFFSMSP